MAGIRYPGTVPHCRLGHRAAGFCAPHHTASAPGCAGHVRIPGTAYSSEDIGLLRLIGRVVAFAIDDNFNLRQTKGRVGERAI